MRPLISENINSKLDAILAKCFEGNRIMDRGMSVLSVKFVMNKTTNVLHPKLAHLFPLLADQVSEYQGSRNNLSVYGVTPLDGTDYESPMQFFERMLNYMIELESMISEAVELTEEEDVATFAFLLRFVKDIGKVTEQCLLLVDKAEAYKNDWQAFDHRIEEFVIL